MLQNSINNNRSGLVGALLLFVLTFSFSACEDKLTIDNRRGENDKQIQDYLRANNIDPATLVNTKSGLYYQKRKKAQALKYMLVITYLFTTKVLCLMELNSTLVMMITSR
ncbi:hypothetical protein GCM10028895_37940 [Pontibacter rugosus]